MLTIEALREALRPLWDAHSELIALWVFGSIAEGRADDQSDVDVAVLSRDAMSLLDQGALTAESMHCLDRNDVDLVEMRSAIPFLQHRILTRGKILFERDAVARVTFQAQALSIYFDLQPWLERAYAR